MTRRTFLPFAPPCLDDREIEAVADALRSGTLTTGPRARRFEEEFATFVGAPAALALNSCSAGLHAALFAAGVGEGDVVVTSPTTYVGTLNAVVRAGARPLLADVAPDTLNVDPARVVETLDRARSDGVRVRALLPVHFAGHPCDMPALVEIAKRHDLALVEDAAHALPTRVGPNLVGAPHAGVASFASFSFYANKNLTTGEGGMLTGTPDAVERARTFSRQGLAGDGPTWRREAVSDGFKYGMPDVAAALGLVQLAKLPDFHARRAALAARYDAALAALDVETPTTRPGVVPSRHLYVVRLPIERLTIDRDRVVEELAVRNVGASVHFRPIGLHPRFRATGLDPEDCPVALAAWPRLLSLPLHPAMADADVDDVVEALGDVLRVHRR